MSKPDAKTRALQASWKDLLLRHTTQPKFAGKYGGMTKQPVPEVLTPVEMTQEQVEARVRVAYSQMVMRPRQAGKATEFKHQFIEQFGQEAWDKREAEAKGVKHTVMHGHKSGYQLVTDPEMVKQMGKKTYEG